MYEVSTEIKPFRIHHYKFKKSIEVEDMNEYKKHIIEEFSNKNRFYAINDMLDITNFKTNYLKFFMELDKLFRNKELVKKCVGCTVIVVNKKSKGFFDLIFKFKKTETPHLITTNLEDAVKFILSLKN
jgi:hypothetical protein